MEQPALSIMGALTNQLQSIPISIQAVIGVVILGVIYSFLTGERPHSGFPVVTLEEKGWKPLFLPHISWMLSPNEVMRKGRQISSSSGIYQIRSGAGYKIMLPRSYADEIRNNPDLSFAEVSIKDFHALRPGFDSIREGLRPDGLMVDVVRVKLTQSLNLVTDDVVDEATYSISKWFGDSQEWRTFPVKQAMLDIVARVSTRVFAGVELARNEEYIHIAKDNTVSIFVAAQELHLIPAFLRPIAQWVLPTCRGLRKQTADARKLLAPQVKIIEERAKKASVTGEKLSGKTADAFSWMVDVSKGRPINFVAGQMLLSMAAIHTTTEMTTRALMQCCENPEVVRDLREEIVRVLKEDGWAKTTLYKMKLLDSFMKEVSRHHRMGIASMGRHVKKNVTLSDGSVLPKGSLILVEDDGPNDPSIYPEPEKFDAYRYLKMRERPGEETRHQFVTTSPDNMTFGHGQHACPGRFFASNEIKILFCFLLLQYDWRFEPGYTPPEDIVFEMAITVSPDVQVQGRKRQEEIDLMDPKEVK